MATLADLLWAVRHPLATRRLWRRHAERQMICWLVAFGTEWKGDDLERRSKFAWLMYDLWR